MAVARIRCAGCGKKISKEQHIVLTRKDTICHQSCFIFPVILQGYKGKGSIKEMINRFKAVRDVEQFLT